MVQVQQEQMLISISNVQFLSALHLLLSLWPNLVTWLSLRSVWRGETTKSVDAGKGFIAALFANISPRLHVCVCVSTRVYLCVPLCVHAHLFVYMHVIASKSSSKRLCMSTHGCASLCARTCVHVDISTVCVHGGSTELQQKQVCEHTHQSAPPCTYMHFMPTCGPMHTCMCDCPIEQGREPGCQYLPQLCLCVYMYP